MRGWIWRLAAALLALLTFSGCTFDGEEGYTHISQQDAARRMTQEDGHVIVDVRRQDEYDGGHIPGAICVPNEEIDTEQPSALPDLDQILLVYCRSGRRSREAAKKLAAIGYTNVYEFGGILSWEGEIVTSEQERQATLSFSSFDGGGPTYTVQIDDPSVVSCQSERQYRRADHAEIDGAGYTARLTITGLRSGQTTATITGDSPIMGVETTVYDVTVDDALRVTLTERPDTEEETEEDVYER